LHERVFDAERFFIDDIEVEISYAKKAIGPAKFTPITQTLFAFPQDPHGTWQRHNDLYTIERKHTED